ncbi:outer membrane beta-barrel protein [Hydrogenophaga sp. BPS33]|uniref:outer membrane beta-barrel protein n=1 Tax=Hydrogenophaga sp. BPS33 TaxID=2651974 RepID=UPI00131FD49B|nr:outer membrane beta-barrel protein [Hydrogenophaga sp. BPS33]QHE85404.1 outer membrane beta-barrel protein [Hydrogenophaga sp. BPS33]
MNRSLPFSLKTGSVAVMAMAVACAVSAQSDMPRNDANTTTVAQAGSAMPAQRRAYAPGEGNFSVIPYTSHGYIGLNLGRSDYDLGCGVGGFGCDSKGNAVNLYTGGMFNRYFGAELGYLHLGRMDRGGGRSEAQGLNLSLVGRVPLGVVHLYGKVGGVYSRTEVTASPLSGIATGKESGWEPSFGAGIGFDLSPRSSIVLEWNRYDMRFVGAGKREVETTSIGYMHRF